MSHLPGVALAAVLCLIAWALALGSASPANLAVGLVVVLGVLLALHRRLFSGAPLGPAELLGRTVAFLPFLLAIAWEIAVGTWRVALIVVGVRQPGLCGVVAVPMEERSDVGVAVSGLVVSLTPGENMLELDWERRVILVHALDIGDPDELRRSQRRFFERFQRRVFP